jgi:hypothetical protein
MTLVHRLGQGIGDAGTHPDHGGLVDAELHRNGIGSLEPDATDVAGQAIGILRHDLHGITAVGLVDAHRSRGADAVAVQENHDLADRLLLGPCGRDAASSQRTDAVHFGRKGSDYQSPEKRVAIRQSAIDKQFPALALANRSIGAH